jgi:hypothetical protein
MSVPTKTKPKAEKTLGEQSTYGEPDTEPHVPAWAENMEHTLRRLAAEKQARRDKQPGLYL